MNATVAQGSEFRLDASTISAALLTVTVLLAGGWACTLIPIVAGYNPGEMLQKLLPIASAGLFPIFRKAFAFRRIGSQGAAVEDAPGYLFVKYAIVGPLLLIGLFEVASFLIGAMSQVVLEILKARTTTDLGDEIKVAVMQSGGLLVVTPFLAVSAAMLGWRIHRRKVRYAVMCLIFIGALFFILRVVDIAWISSQSDTALKKVFEGANKVAVYLFPTGVVVIAMLLGFTSSAVGRGIMRLFGRTAKIA